MSLTGNPTSTLTRPSDTSAYAANDLVASSTTAGSIVVPSFALISTGAFQGGQFRGLVIRLRLVSNHTTGLSAVSAAVRLWSAAPTFTNGDNGAYAVATGAAGYLGQFQGAFEQFADGAAAVLVPTVGPAACFVGAAAAIFWDLQTLTAFTPQSGKTFTLAAEIDLD